MMPATAQQRYRARHLERVRAAGRRYQAKRRREQPEKVAAETARHSAKAQARNRRIIEEAKRAGCTRCPEQDPVALDFHHCRGPKRQRIALAVNKRWSEHRLLTEIAKCDVLCANCHRKEHRV